MSSLFNAALAMKPLSRFQIENKALDLLFEACPERVQNPGAINVMDLLDRVMYEKHGYFVRLADDLHYQTEAETNFASQEILFPTEEWEKLEAGFRRQRTTAAHEVGHIELHKEEMTWQIVHKKVSMQRTHPREIKKYENPEWQANNFAGALLMPAPAVIALIKQRRREDLIEYGDVKAIADTFKVSRIAASVRYSILREMDHNQLVALNKRTT